MNILSYVSTTHLLPSHFHNYPIKTYFLLNPFPAASFDFPSFASQIPYKTLYIFLPTRNLEDIKGKMTDYDGAVFSMPFQLTKTMHRSPYELILPENPANSQTGKIIVITGAGQGLGQTSANVWARARAFGIVLARRRVEKLEETAKGIPEKYRETEVLIAKTDVTVKDDVENLFAEVKLKLGRGVDVLLANAGYFEELGLIGDVDVDNWWNAMMSIYLGRRIWKKGN
jgi:hypothetical protein